MKKSNKQNSTIETTKAYVFPLDTYKDAIKTIESKGREYGLGNKDFPELKDINTEPDIERLNWSKESKESLQEIINTSRAMKTVVAYVVAYNPGVDIGTILMLLNSVNTKDEYISVIRALNPEYKKEVVKEEVKQEPVKEEPKQEIKQENKEKEKTMKTNNTEEGKKGMKIQVEQLAVTEEVKQEPGFFKSLSDNYPITNTIVNIAFGAAVGAVLYFGTKKLLEMSGEEQELSEIELVELLNSLK